MLSVLLYLEVVVKQDVDVGLKIIQSFLMLLCFPCFGVDDRSK